MTDDLLLHINRTDFFKLIQDAYNRGYRDGSEGRAKNVASAELVQDGETYKFRTTSMPRESEVDADEQI